MLFQKLFMIKLHKILLKIRQNTKIENYKEEDLLVMENFLIQEQCLWIQCFHLNNNLSFNKQID